MKINDYRFKKLYEECGSSSYDTSSSSYNDYSKYTKKSDKITAIKIQSHMSTEEAEEFLEEHDWDLEAALKTLKEKKKKPVDKKVFKIGDKVVCIDNKPGKSMPKDCLDFLLTYKYFTVKDVNDKLNIDLGHKLAENGNPYYFSPNRFELKDGKAPIKKADTGEIVDALEIKEKDNGEKSKKYTDWLNSRKKEKEVKDWRERMDNPWLPG